jgi:membrane associated rhomboid family serine protease
VSDSDSAPNDTYAEAVQKLASHADLQRRSHVIMLVMWATWICFLIAEVTDRDWVSAHFAKSDRVYTGEWWRLVTAMFVHANFLHVACNMLALVALGRMVAAVFGGARTVAVYFVGGAVGFVASMLFVPEPSIGASGGVFALLGCTFAFGMRFRTTLTPVIRQTYCNRAAWWIGMNLAIGFALPSIDNAAHIGGMLAGIVAAALMDPDPMRGFIDETT